MSQPSHDRPRIGFIGLGIMGHPMAGHLVSGGYALTAFDTSDTAAARLQAAHPGVVVADSVAAVGAAADIVITMLPDGQRVQEVALAAGGLVESMAPGSLLLDTSSAQPWLTVATAQGLAARGIGMVDAPVSGAQWGAEQAGQPRLHGRWGAGRPRPGAPAPRPARAGRLPLRAPRRGSHHEVHQQHHHTCLAVLAGRISARSDCCRRAGCGSGHQTHSRPCLADATALDVLPPAMREDAERNLHVDLA